MGQTRDRKEDRHRPRLAAVSAVAALLAGPAAASPSFDCGQARTPVELLICGDGRLAELDGRLAEVYQALRSQAAGSSGERLLREQRAWVVERDKRCAVPARGGAPALADRWEWAPCLAERYQERLAALGAPVEPVAPPAVASEPGYLHPHCLDLALGGRAGSGDGRPLPVLIAACNRGYRHVPVTGREAPGWLAASDLSGEGRAWLAYRSLGNLPDGRSLIQVEWSGGGTGIFSEIAAVRRSTGSSPGLTTVTAQTVFGGGDRCNSGIAEARLAGEALEVVVRATPAGLIAAGDPTIDTLRHGLDDCAICCVGTVRYRLDPVRGSDQVTGATISETLAAEGDSVDSAQACFDKQVRGRGPLPQTLAAADLTAFSRQFVAACPISRPD